MDISDLLLSKSRGYLHTLAQHDIYSRRCFISADNDKTDKLQGDLQGLGFSFVRINGGYQRDDVIDIEPCFLVTASLDDALFTELMLALHSKYDQNVILMGEPADKYYFYYSDNTVKIAGQRITSKAIKQYFSKLTNKKYIIVDIELHPSQLNGTSMLNKLMQRTGLRRELLGGEHDMVKIF